MQRFVVSMSSLLGPGNVHKLVVEKVVRCTTVCTVPKFKFQISEIHIFYLFHTSWVKFCRSKQDFKEKIEGI